MRDPMERLAAADPLLDGEQLDAEAQREADALLAQVLATPVEPVTRKRPRLRRWTLATAAAAAAAALAAVVFVGSDVDQAVAARSVAAVSRDDSVYHIVQRRTVTGDRQGPTTIPVRIESWYASDGRLHEKFSAADDGRLLEEAAGRSWLIRWYGEENRLAAEGRGRSGDAGKLPVIDPAGDPGATLRALEARGALKVEEETDRGYRLVSEPIEVESGEYRFQYVVDRETYLPIEERWTMTTGGETIGLVRQFLTYERLPLDATSEAQLDLDPHPDATCSAEANQPTERELGFPNPCR
jgi:hypothetical protein